MQKIVFLYLIVYCVTNSNAFCQNLGLKITGQSTAENTIIDSLGYKPFHANHKAVMHEVDSTMWRLTKIGFIENKLVDLKKTTDSTYLATLNLKQRFSAIAINYDSTKINAKLLKHITANVYPTYFKIKLEQLEDALNYINRKQAENGRPFSRLKLSQIRIDQHNNLKADLSFSPTQTKRYIDTIILKGYEKFPKSFLKYYLKLKPKQVFNLNLIRAKTKTLNNLKFAKEIKPAEVLFSKDSTSLYVYLEKTKSNTFDGFLGFGTNEQTSKLEFNGYLNLNLTNNLNSGESFALLYKSDENSQKTFDTNLEIPYVFKSPIGINLQLRIFKKDSSYSTVNQLAKLLYQINAKHKVFTGINTTESNNLLKKNTNNFIKSYKSRYFLLGYHYQQLQANNPLFNTKTYGFIETHLGKRKQSNSTENQYAVTANIFNIFNLDTKNSIFLKASSALLDSSTYFENELFFLGGINSIRGFEENSIQASMYGILNTEYRYQLNHSMYIHTISDIGYYENKISTRKEKLYTFGFGFGILTNAGLLRFNYANGKNENTKFKFSNSKIHLSLSTSF